MDNEPPDMFLLVLALILLLLVGSIVFAIKMPYKADVGFISVNECFIYAPNIPHYYKAKTYGTLVSEVIDCESGWKQYDEDGNLLTGKSGEIGIAQFMPATWKVFNEERGTNLDITDREDQLDMIEWAFQNNKQNHWTCYVQKNM